MIAVTSFRLNKDAVIDFIEDSADKDYYFLLLKGITPFALSIIIALGIFMIYNNVALVFVPPIAELLLSEILGIMLPQVSQSGYSIISTIHNRQRMKKADLEKIKVRLEMNE